MQLEAALASLTRARACLQLYLRVQILSAHHKRRDDKYAVLPHHTAPQQHQRGQLLSWRAVLQPDQHDGEPCSVIILLLHVAIKGQISCQQSATNHAGTRSCLLLTFSASSFICVVTAFAHEMLLRSSTTGRNISYWWTACRSSTSRGQCRRCMAACLCSTRIASACSRQVLR